MADELNVRSQFERRLFDLRRQERLHAAPCPVGLKGEI